jgi:hypothetical protein
MSEKVNQVGEYLTIGRITNPLLLNFLRKSQKKYLALSKKTSKSCKGVILDGEHITATKIIKSTEIKEAIDQSKPIIISEPTKSEVNAITGFGIEGSKAMVIIPRKRGKEFEIQLIDSNHDNSSQALEEEQKIISTVVDHYKVDTSNNDEKKDDDKETPSIPHRRWTVLEAKPHLWGDEKGSYIHVGFQYDLFYVCSPKPARKYLYVKCIGNGISSGKLKHDHLFHRGYYQDRVIIDIKGESGDSWTGPRLKLEDYTPQSENRENEEQDIVGYQLWCNTCLGIAFAGNSAITNTGATWGLGLFTQHSIATTFNEFSVSFEPTISSEQWTFWMNGAQGAKIRKEHPSRDIVSRKYGLICTVKELPQLANNSVLHPEVQALYFTHGDQLGNWTITATVRQYLRDIKSWVLFRKTKKDLHEISQTVTIDFSQVTGDDKCKKDNKDIDNRDIDKIKGKGKIKDQDKDKGKNKGKNKVKDKDKVKNKDKGKGKDKDKDKGKGKSKGKSKDKRIG